MTYIVYRAVSPNSKYYIGITNNFKRRMKEHRRSVYPFGRALRKHGEENFTFSFIEVDTVDKALEIERFCVTDVEVKSDQCYNACVGGLLSDVLANKNPMHCREVVDNHPSLFTTQGNPMFDPELKAKMIASQQCKKVSVDGIEYYGVREAARNLGESRQCIVHRLKAESFPTYYYL